jgi:hypothetical protein
MIKRETNRAQAARLQDYLNAVYSQLMAQNLRRK